jgi:hypothetical protein
MQDKRSLHVLFFRAQKKERHEVECSHQQGTTEALVNRLQDPRPREARWGIRQNTISYSMLVTL